MSRLRDVLVVIAVACAVSGSSLVLGQAQKVAVRPEGRGKEEGGSQGRPQEQGRRGEEGGGPESRGPEAGGRGPEAGGRVQPAAVLDAQAAQYVEQFRPMFKSEYYFIGNACDLTKDQRKQLARLGETAVKAAARQFVEAQQKMMRGGWRPGMEYPDPRRLIEDELARSDDQLSDSRAAGAVQARTGEADRQPQAGGHRQSGREARPGPRADLAAACQAGRALRTNWKDSWGQSLEMLQNINNFFPNIPDQVVAPILTDLQKESLAENPQEYGGLLGVQLGRDGHGP